MIFLKDQIEYSDPDSGEKLIGQVVSKSPEGVLECNLLYPTPSKQPGEKFFVNMEDKNIKKAAIKPQPYDKHKSQYSFNKESMEIVKDEEAVLKLGMKKLSKLDKKYSDRNIPIKNWEEKKNEEQRLRRNPIRQTSNYNEALAQSPFELFKSYILSLSEEMMESMKNDYPPSELKGYSDLRENLKFSTNSSEIFTLIEELGFDLFYELKNFVSNNGS